jgi:hypothetical protein
MEQIKFLYTVNVLKLGEWNIQQSNWYGDIMNCWIQLPLTYLTLKNPYLLLLCSEILLGTKIHQLVKQFLVYMKPKFY